MKRILALVLAVVMLAAGLASCQPKNDFGDNVSLKVWGSQDDQAMLSEMIEAFKTEYKGTTWDITLGVVGEPDAMSRYLEDPEAAADIFSYANDQIVDLVNAGALYEVAGTYKEFVEKNNGTGSIAAATQNGKIYGFPTTADNGYFMYYDKSVFSADDIKSLETMLDVANAAGKKVFFDLSNGWYIASFFLGAGGNLAIGADGKQQCDFNNANGVLAGEAIKAIAAHPGFMTGDDAVLTGGMGTTLAAGVSGTWNKNAIMEALGDNYSAAKLPTFNLGGTATQLSSFGGYKQYGISSLTKHPDAAMALAQWLTNEANQIKRFEMRGYGPSNIKAAASAAVQADPALAALAAQGAFAITQNEVLGSYWAPAEAFGAAMESKDYSQPVQAQLDAMVAQITA